MNELMSAPTLAARQRVGVLWRVAASYAALVPPLTASFAAVILVMVPERMTLVGAPAMASVLTGLSDALSASAVGLNLAALLGIGAVITGIAGSRPLRPRPVGPPPAWFYLALAAISLLPIALLWHAESQLIAVITSGTGDIESITSRIAPWLTLTTIAGVVATLLVIGLALVPFTAPRAVRSFLPIIASLVFEAALVAAAVAFHVRISWLSQLARTNQL